MPLDLKRFFLAEGNDLNFFQAVYLLEKFYSGRGRVGTGDDLRSEALRFETLNTLAFPPSEVASINPPLTLQGQAEALESRAAREQEAKPDLAALPPLADILREGRGPLRMSLTFMGLYGVSSPLPAYFVDPITLKKVEYFELKKFLDIFSHRLYSLFYRAWKKYRHFAQFRNDPPDDYTLRLLALTGQWPGGRARPGKDSREGGTGLDLRRIPFARFLGNRVRSAKGLQQLLRGYFGFRRVVIRQFTPTWVEIPVKTCLGGAGTALGLSTRLGDRMEDRLSRFTVEIGPLPRALFNRFLPSSGIDAPEESPLLAQVRELIHAYLRDPLEFGIKVILDPESEQAPVLGSAHARMGMGVWLGERAAEEIACLQ